MKRLTVLLSVLFLFLLAGLNSWAAAPGAQARYLSFTSVGTTSLTLSWSNNGTNNGVVVFGQQTNTYNNTTVANRPVDGTDYSAVGPTQANSAWGSAGVEGGSKVLYIGTGNSVTITGLTANTYYSFMVYQFLNDGGTDPEFNVTTSTANPRYRRTALPSVVAPTTLAYNSLDENSFIITFTDDVANEGYNFDLTTDNTYATNSIAMYDNADIGDVSSFLVEGLSSCTNYYWRLQSYVNDNTSSWVNYGAPDAVRTWAATAPSTVASGINATARETNYLTLSWTAAGAPGADGYVLRFDDDSEEAPTYTDGTAVTLSGWSAGGSQDVYQGTTLSTTVGPTLNGAPVASTLTPETAYYFYLYSYNACNTPASGYRYYTGANYTNWAGTAIYTLSNPHTIGSVGSITFSGLTNACAANDATMNLAWTGSTKPGSGATQHGYFVVLRAGSAPALSPTDGSAVTNLSYAGTEDGAWANKTAPNGTDYVIYNQNTVLGTNLTNSASLTGLPEGATYYYAVYAYTWNGTGANATYNYTLVASGSKAVIDEPLTWGAGPFSATQTAPLSGTELTFTWTAVPGATGYIVVAKQGGAAVGTPVDGQSFTLASTAFGTTATNAGTLFTGGEAASYLVYAGTTAGCTVTGLAAATSYSFEIYAYEGNNTGSANFWDCTSASYESIAATFTTLCDNPTGVASNGTFTGLGVTSYTLNYDAAAPAPTGGYLIVGRASSATGFSPTDGTYSTYTANLAFTSGYNTTTGYVVKRSAGLSAAITGLTADTEYFWTIWPYNCAADNQVNYGSSYTMTRKTLAVEPTTVAAIAVNNPTLYPTQAGITLTPGVDDGATYIVIAKQGAAPGFTPVDGTSYTANTAFGSGQLVAAGEYVVYQGSGTTFTVTGLTAGTEYYYEVWTFDGTGGSENYFGSNTTNRYTLAADITSCPSGTPTFSALGSSQYTLTWTPGNGTYTVLLAYISDPGAAPAEIVDGTSFATAGNLDYSAATALAAGARVIYNGANTNSAVITGLTPNTNYYFRVYEYNGTLTATNWCATSITANRYTLANYAFGTAPTAGIESATRTSTGLYLTWTGGTGARRLVTISTSFSGTTGPADGQAYTADLTYNNGQSTIDGGYVVYDGTTTNNPAPGIQVTGLNPETQYFIRVYTYNQGDNTTTNNYAVAGGEYGTANAYTLASSPIAPTAATITAKTDGGATMGFTVSWTPGTPNPPATVTPDGYIVVLREGNATVGAPSNGIDPTAHAVGAINADYGVATAGQNGINAAAKVLYNGNSTSVVLTGLTAETMEYVAVFAYKGSGASTVWSAPATANEYTLATQPAVNDAVLAVTAKTNTTVTFQQWNTSFGTAPLPENYIGMTAQGAVAPAFTFTDGTNPAFTLGTTPVVWNNIANVATGATPTSYTMGWGTGAAAVNLTGLTPATQYTISVFPYRDNGVNGTSNNYNNTPATLSFYTYATTPDNPTALTNTSRTVNSLGLSWTGGANTAGYVVYIGADPGQTAGTAPAGGSIYNGATASTLSTTLAAATGYTYYVYAYNWDGANAATYSYSAVLTNGSAFYTLSTEPTVSPNGLVFANHTNGGGTSSMDVSWTAGNGTYSLVIARASASPTGVPTDGTNYTANAAYGTLASALGDGYVVYSGAGTSFTLTNLTPETTYYFDVYTYNANGLPGNLTHNYFGTQLEGSRVAIAIPTTNVTAYTVDQYQQNGYRINWTHSGTNVDNFMVLLGADGEGFGTTPVNGITYSGNTNYLSASFLGTAKIVYVGSAQTATITGLSTATKHDFKIIAIHGTAGAENYQTGLAGTGTTVSAVPTSSATNLTANRNSATPTAVNLTWTAGSGPRELVLVSSADNTAGPTNATNYVGALASPFGTVIGNGATAFSGIGTAAALTGLTPNSLYYANVWTYNGTGTSSNYNNPTGAAASNDEEYFYTFATEPANLAGLVATPTQGATPSVALSWTTAGAGVKYVILRNTTGVFGAITDGTNTASLTDYLAENAADDVDYTDNTVVNGTTYYYKVYAFNGQNYTTPAGNSMNYEATGQASGAQIIYCVTPGAVTAATASTYTTTTANVTLTANGTPTGYLVMYATSNAAETAPTIGTAYVAGNTLGSWTVGYVGASTTPTIPDLTPGTKYWVRVYQYSCAAPYIAYSASSSAFNVYTYSVEPTAFTASLTLANSGTTTQDITVASTNGNKYYAYTSAQTFTDGTTAPAATATSTASPLQVTGLTPGTSYTWQVYTSNWNGADVQTYNYLATVQTVTAYTAPNAPASHSNTPALGELTITWTAPASGGVTGYYVVIGTSDGALSTPTDGTTYTGDVTWNGGTNQVAFYDIDANPKTVTVTGLTNGTTYYYRVYAYAGSGVGANYGTYVAGSGTPNGSFATEPTAQMRAIDATGNGTGSLTLNWINNEAGMGTSTILIGRTTNMSHSDATIRPVDGTSYTATAAFGTGAQIGTAYILYNGTGNSVTVSNLTIGANYYFRVYGYNGSGATANYLTTSSSNSQRGYTAKFGSNDTQLNNLDKESFSVSTINPNPVVNNINFTIETFDDNNLTISVYNLSGKLIYSIPAKNYTNGSYVINIPIKNWSAGAYFLNVSNGDELATQQFIVKP